MPSTLDLLVLLGIVIGAIVLTTWQLFREDDLPEFEDA